MFLQCVRIELHSSSLTNVENSTSNFRQSVQIWYREEQKEENNGNCKAFRAASKTNKFSCNLFFARRSTTKNINNAYTFETFVVG